MKLALLFVVAALAWGQNQSPGNGAPTMSCVAGQEYFQSDAADGENKWWCNAKGVWVHLVPAGSSLGYTIAVHALNSSPGDAQIAYFGNLGGAPTMSTGVRKVYIRKAATIKIAEIYSWAGTAGTGEAWSLYIRLNGTTDYLIATLEVAAAERIFSNTTLSIPVVAGDYFEIKSAHPTWATNPLNIIFGGYIYLE